ncbi:VOC family protein [Bosea sp. BK604]|uniref:VOC family protein n=1 Tax=Bosea sp. BK604 TaxID=2512180 RepID=UPI00104CD2FA|nr:VOC family protein [Bosea sp. BK604]TCR59431.1 catechol 2,3-dioxygenase-like lactoylglutathione lyase family enzyme [Bosea sp. BK604]
MVSWSLHHVNLNAHNVAESAKFFGEILGLDGGRSRDAIAGVTSNAKTGAYYFGEGTSGLHICRPDLMLALKHNMPINPSVGGHVAITVQDLDAVKRRLDAVGIVYADPGSWAIAGLRQIYVCDPSMNVIELNQIVG